MDKKVILIVEDDEKVIDIITAKLDDSYIIYSAPSIAKARLILKKKHIDLVCLDVLLPDGSGLFFCKNLKKELPDIKVIILTKRIYIEDRLESFKSGADDYLSKPFYPEELIARIEHLLTPTCNDEGIYFSDMKLCTSDTILHYKTITVLLTDTERDILEYLFLHNGKANRESLVKYLKTKEHKNLSGNAFTVSINRLKKKLVQNTGLSIIKSRYGHGYYIAI